MTNIQKGQLFRHHSGDLYVIDSVGLSSVDQTPIIGYKSTKDGQVWFDKQDCFESTIKDSEGNDVPRFTQMDNLEENENVEVTTVGDIRSQLTPFEDNAKLVFCETRGNALRPVSTVASMDATDDGIVMVAPNTAPLTSPQDSQQKVSVRFISSDEKGQYPDNTTVIRRDRTTGLFTYAVINHCDQPTVFEDLASAHPTFIDTIIKIFEYAHEENYTVLKDTYEELCYVGWVVATW